MIVLSNTFIMEVNVNQLVRSAVVLAIGLPISVGVAVNGLRTPEKNESVIVQSEIKADLTVPCLKYALSKADSKLEREAKDEIDEVMGGEVNYVETCKWAL